MTSARLEVPVLQADHTSNDLATAIDKAGCCVVERAVSPAVMDSVAADMAPFVESTPRGATDFAGAGTRRTGLVIGRSPTFREHLALHPSVMAAGDHVLGHAQAWNLSFAHYFELFRSESTQLLHRDTWKYGAPPLGIEVDLNALWAVSDFTETNGATRVVPGSHRWEPDRRPKPGDDVPVVTPRGSVFFYTGLVFHGGGTNITDDARLAVNAQHSVGWLSQTELMLLEYPPQTVADWDDDLIRLIGYQLSGPALGHWRNNEDPFAAVREYREASPR